MSCELVALLSQEAIQSERGYRAHRELGQELLLHHQQTK